MKSTIVTAFLGFASLAIAAPAQIITRQTSLEQVTDSYVFDISIAEFIDNRNAKTGPAELDWSSNGCTASPDNPFGFDCTFCHSSFPFFPFYFRFFPFCFPFSFSFCLLLPQFYLLTTTVINSCYRHDFGYRNFKKQNRFDANKARIDDKFKTDLFNQCADEAAKGPCEATATLYYEAVKTFGKKRDLEMAEEKRAVDE